MRIAYIIDDGKNPTLSRFTQAKLFFNAQNQATNFVSDCEIVDNFDQAVAQAKENLYSVIIDNGTLLTSEFQIQHQNVHGMIDARNRGDIIKFDSDTYIGLSRRSHYASGTKQLYIIENLLRTCINNKKLVYLDNTEELGEFPKQKYQHLVGLASGWKTVELAAKLDFDVESITVYDRNPVQLDHARWLHSHTTLPTECRTYDYTCGVYSPNINTDIWEKWHKFPVQFKEIDLFETPRFPDQSLIWVSNVFFYESNIFDFGWKTCKNKHKMFIEHNTGSIII